MWEMKLYRSRDFLRHIHTLTFAPSTFISVSTFLFFDQIKVRQCINIRKSFYRYVLTNFSYFIDRDYTAEIISLLVSKNVCTDLAATTQT